MDEHNKVNIIIMTHGNLGAELLKSTEMIVGPISDVYTFSIFPEMSIESYIEDISKTIENFTERDLLFLVDILGGTPYNIACLLAEEKKGEVITGLNMNLLITAAEVRKDNSIDDIPKIIIKKMRKKDFYIKHYKRILK